MFAVTKTLQILDDENLSYFSQIAVNVLLMNSSVETPYVSLASLCVMEITTVETTPTRPTPNAEVLNVNLLLDSAVPIQGYASTSSNSVTDTMIVDQMTSRTNI